MTTTDNKLITLYTRGALFFSQSYKVDQALHEI